MTRRLLLRVAGASVRRLPPEWAEAARRESEHVAGTRELARWTLGLVRLALPPRRVWAVLLAVGAAPAWLDLRLDSSLTALAALLLAAGAAGAATRRPVAAGVVVGLAVAAVRVGYAASGGTAPSGPTSALGSLALVALVVPALAAAAAGAALRR